MNVAIVTDSTSDIEPDEARALGVDIVPLFVQFGERRYRDRIDLSRSEFYRMLSSERELPTTSQPTAKMFEDAFAPHVAGGREIVCVLIASQLSGTINAARAAADQFPTARITLIDSQTVAGGLALAVRRAQELAGNGASAGEIEEELARLRGTQSAYATLPDLSHAVRTGRIGKAQAAVGTLLRIVPVLKVEGGEVREEARVRTFARALETIVESTLRDLRSAADARVVVMHANAPALAESLAARLRERLATPPAYLGIAEAGPVIAVHAGQGAAGIFSLSV